MITGRLIIHNNHYYAMMNLKHDDGRRYQKRINLDLPVCNNKRAAEAKLSELKVEYSHQQLVQKNSSKAPFDDFARDWLVRKKPELSPTTFDRYNNMLEHAIIPVFSDYLVKQVSTQLIEDFYHERHQNGLSGTTIQHYHMLLKQLFAQACRRGIITQNPMELVRKPKRQPSNITHYSATEAKQLWDVVEGHRLEVVVKLALFYGFRRSEVLGLRWEDIDFDNETISIRNAVVTAVVSGKRVTTSKPSLKQEASRRTLPMDQTIKELLKQEHSDKKKHRSQYVCTDKNGKPITPDGVTHSFRKLLKKQGLRHIRFHDLRHTCASLLISERTPLIEVQHWLGHKTMLTTANLYAHLEYESKLTNAETMKKFSLTKTKGENEHE